MTAVYSDWAGRTWEAAAGRSGFIQREFYGIDAPTIVPNLRGRGALLLAGILAVRGWPLGAPLAPTLEGSGAGTTIGAVAMLVSSHWLGHIVMRRLLNTRQWRGDGEVLDVARGRGLTAIRARLAPRGFVHAIDLWQSADPACPRIPARVTWRRNRTATLPPF